MRLRPLLLCNICRFLISMFEVFVTKSCLAGAVECLLKPDF